MVKRIVKYINHFLTARSKLSRGIQSKPIKYLVEHIIFDFTPYYSFPEIEKQRKKLFANNNTINITDFGAGSKLFKGNQRKISKIAKYSLKPAKQAQLLFRLANYFQPANIIEFGTCLGITSSYLAKVNSSSKVLTFEGCPAQLNIAKNIFANLNISYITTIQGNINDTLIPAIEKINELDFVFFDGNHTKKATQHYFSLCLKKASTKSVFIFDDIHMNDDMESFWLELKQHKQISTTIDLFHLGIVLFNPAYKKQHLKLRF